jgi:hypothetical protein
MDHIAFSVTALLHERRGGWPKLVKTAAVSFEPKNGIAMVHPTDERANRRLRISDEETVPLVPSRHISQDCEKSIGSSRAHRDCKPLVIIPVSKFIDILFSAMTAFEGPKECSLGPK